MTRPGADPEAAAREDEPPAAPAVGGIRIDGVEGDVALNAGGDIVGGDKIINVSATIVVPATVTRSRPLNAVSPYRGLNRFENSNRELFFGREQLVHGLLRRLTTEPLLLILGASGSGKSSVVRAGLLPAFEKREGNQQRQFVLVPDVNPFAGLRSSLISAGFSQGDTEPLVNQAPDAVLRVVEKLRRDGERWIFFVDQFEELFTRTTQALREPFLGALLALLNRRGDSIRIVLAMRSEFVERLSSFPRFAKRAQRNIEIMTDMQADELRLAIEQPAALHGVVFEDGLVDEIIGDVRGRPGSLPLLEYTLDRLWREEARRGGLESRRLMTGTYREIGGVRGALETRAHQIYQSLGTDRTPGAGDSQREIARQILLRLADVVTAGDQPAQPVRRRVPIDEFQRPGEREVLDRLIDEALLVSDRDGATGPSGAAAGRSTVEVAHEAIFECWRDLKKWVEEAKRVIFVKNRVADDSTRWRERGGGAVGTAADELWAGSRLDEAIELRARGDFASVVGGLTADEGQFIDVSVAAREARVQAANRRRRRALVSLAGGLAVALLLLGAAVLQWRIATRQTRLLDAARREAERQARIAQVQRLAAQADSAATSGRLETGALLAVEAGRRMSSLKAQTLDVDQVLRKMLSRIPHRAANIIVPGIVPWNSTFSLDGSKFGALVSEDGKDAAFASVWDTALGKEVFRISCSPEGSSIHLSPDGKLVALGSSAHGFRVWELGSHAEIVSARTPDGEGRALAFSPDGRLVAAVTRAKSGGRSSETLSLFDVSASWRSRRISSDNVRKLTFSPAGDYLLTASMSDEGDDATMLALDTRTLQTVGSIYQGEEAQFSPDGAQIAATRLIFDSTGHILGDPVFYRAPTRAAPKVTFLSEESNGGKSSLFVRHPFAAFCRQKQPKYLAESLDDAVVIYEEADKKAKEVEAEVEVARLPMPERLQSLVFDADCTHILVSTSKGFDSWATVASDIVPSLVNHEAYAISVDDELIARVVHSNAVTVSRIQTGREICRLPHPDAVVWSLALAPKGDRLATLDVNGDVRIWQPNTCSTTPTSLIHLQAEHGSVHFVQSGHLIVVKHVYPEWTIFDVDGDAVTGKITIESSDRWTISHDGRLLAVVHGREIKVLGQWSTEKPSVVARTEVAKEGPRGDVEFAPSDREIVFRDEGYVVVGLLGDRLKTLRRTGPFGALFDAGLSADGRVLAAATEEGVMLWSDWTTREGLPPAVSLVFPFRNPRDGWRVSSSLSPDGRYLSFDSSVWDLQTFLAVTERKSSAESSLTFSPAGRFWGSTFWRSDDLATELASRLDRLLTSEERHRYAIDEPALGHAPSTAH